MAPCEEKKHPRETHKKIPHKRPLREEKQNNKYNLSKLSLLKVMKSNHLQNCSQ